MPRILTRAIQEVRENGIRSLFRLVLINLRASWRIVILRTFGDAFDRGLGVDTASPVFGPVLQADRQRNYWYEASPVGAFNDIIRDTAVQFDRYTFIDLGCGKGRTLLLAAAFPFASIIGVELSQQLCDIARTNCAKLPARSRVRCHVLELDATEFKFPAGPLMIYLYNPFGAEVMARVFENLRQSLETNPREIIVIYLNATQAKELDRLPWLKCVRTIRSKNLNADEIKKVFVNVMGPPYAHTP